MNGFTRSFCVSEYNNKPFVINIEDDRHNLVHVYDSEYALLSNIIQLNSIE